MVCSNLKFVTGHNFGKRPSWPIWYPIMAIEMLYPMHTHHVLLDATQYAASQKLTHDVWRVHTEH